MICNIAAPDLPTRLHGTICLYEDIPYYISVDDTPGEHEKIFLNDLVTKRTVNRIFHNDPKFDVSTPPLGYTQIMLNRVCFIERVPHRQFRQGIVASVLNYSYFQERHKFLLHSEYFRATMMRLYPSLKTVIAFLLKDPDYGEYAISNDCCLVKSAEGIVKVFFKHEEVAFTTVAELKKKEPVIHVPSTTKAWITNRYLSLFDWTIVQS